MSTHDNPYMMSAALGTANAMVVSQSPSRHAGVAVLRYFREPRRGRKVAIVFAERD